ncbi:permease [Psychromonas sp. MME2]|uniref:permease n=1 Tax=unclassified Psychromonas TaxID=2614957 RepID=UPI00339BF938
MLLLISLFALFLGPITYRILQRQSGWIDLVDAFIFVTISGLVLFHILPELLHSGGLIVLVLMALGILAPSWIEKYFHKAAHQAHQTTLFLGILGLILHASIDGSVLIFDPDNHTSWLLALGVLLHRFPVGLTIWWLLRPQYGRALPIFILTCMSIATLIGAYYADYSLAQLDGQWLAWLQAFVMGSIMHVVLHRPYFHGHGQETPPSENKYAAGIGSLIGLLVLGSVLLPHWLGYIEHHHDHGAIATTEAHHYDHQHIEASNEALHDDHDHQHIATSNEALHDDHDHQHIATSNEALHDDHDHQHIATSNEALHDDHDHQHIATSNEALHDDHDHQHIATSNEALHDDHDHQHIAASNETLHDDHDHQHIAVSNETLHDDQGNKIANSGDTDEHRQHNTALTLINFTNIAMHSAPMLLLAYFLSALMHYFKPKFSILPVQDSQTFFADSLKGVAYGLPLPICSPSATKMHQHLLSMGANQTFATAFLIAAPIVGFDALLISWPLLGEQLLLLRIVLAALFALLIAWVIGRHFKLQHTTSAANTNQCEHSSSRFVNAVKQGYQHQLDHTAPWVLLGWMLAATLSAASVWDFFGQALWLQVIVMIAVAFPFALCATGITPVIAMLLLAGLSPGAAIAFFLIAPTISIELLKMIRQQQGVFAAMSLAMLMVGGAFIIGLGINQYIDTISLSWLQQQGNYSWWQIISLCIILTLYLSSLLRRGARSFIAELVPKSFMKIRHKHH